MTLTIDAKQPANIPINPGWTYKFRPNPPDRNAATYELKLEIAADRAGIFQVFYSSDPAGFRETDSDAHPFNGGGEFQTLKFLIQVTGRFTLRLDPGSNTGKIQLRNIELWQNGERLARISALSLKAQNDIMINTSETSDNFLSATVSESGIDPMLLVPQQAMDSLLP